MFSREVIDLPETQHSVYRATNFKTEKVAACKVVALKSDTKPEERRALEKEMKIHSSLKHRNVLEFIAAIIVDPKSHSEYYPAVYMLMEIAAGGDLFDKIGECSPTHRDAMD